MSVNCAGMNIKRFVFLLLLIPFLTGIILTWSLPGSTLGLEIIRMEGIACALIVFTGLLYSVWRWLK